MARIRTIKPDFFTSEDIVSLSPLARLLYIALWCEADREGRMAWKPKTFKMRYLPGDDCNCEALCAELTERGLIVLYGDGLAYVPSFSDHQHLNPRETPSSLPVPDASARVGTRRPRASDAQGGREGKGREGKVAKSHASKAPIPEGFEISERVRAWAAEKGHGQLEARLESFKGQCTAKGYTYADWDAAFMNSIRDNWAKLGPSPTNTLPAGGRRRLG